MPLRLRMPARTPPGRRRRSLRWHALALLAWLVAGTAAAQDAGPAQDLLDAYARARAGDPVLRAADANRRSVEQGVAQARAPLLPQAAASVGLAQSRAPDASGQNATLRSRDVSASVGQVLVDLGQLARLSAAESRDAAGQSGYRAAEQALVVRVATAYFDVLTALDLRANTEAVEAAFAQQVAQSDERYRAGLVAMVSVDQARAYHASARAATIAARKAYDDAAEALAEITGMRADRLKALRDDLPLVGPQPADPQAWVAAAWQGNPQIAAQQHELEAAGHAVEAARAGHLPTLGASLEVGRPASWPDGAALGRDGRTVASVGVLLRVPLFSGGLTQSQVRQSLAQRDAAGADLEALRRRVARETLDHYRDVMAAIGQTEATRAAVESARKALASTRVGHELGTQTMTDLLLAIQTLSAAQGAYAQARHRYVTGQLLLRRSTGQVGEDDLRAVNRLLQ